MHSPSRAAPDEVSFKMRPSPRTRPSSPLSPSAGSISSSDSSAASSLSNKSITSSSLASRRPIRQQMPMVRTGFMIMCFFVLLCCTGTIQTTSMLRASLQLLPPTMTTSTTSLPQQDPQLHRNLGTQPTRKADGYFNGFPVLRVNEKPSSSIHCIGENYNESTAWLFRSCQFETYCFDIDQKEFVVFLDEDPVRYDIPKNYYLRGFSSTNHDQDSMAVWGGSQSLSWMPGRAEETFGVDEPIGMFRPKVQIGKGPDMYYYMPETTIANFFRHPKSFRNPGHLIWDDFMGLYNLLDIFDLLDERLMLSELNRTIDPEQIQTPEDFDLIQKFVPLMGQHNYDVQTYKGFDADHLTWPNKLRHKKNQQQRVVCAAHGVVGSGMFSDHGHDHWHGQSWYDYVRPHNNGRGGLFRRYREFMLKNVGINPDTQMQRPYQMIVSQNSTTKGLRTGLMFQEQIDALEHRYGRSRLHIRPVVLHKLSLREQLEMTAQSALFLSVVGGGSVTAFFLPKGASLLLYPTSSKLDWDLFNNYPHVVSHWLPKIDYMLLKNEMKYFVDLVGAELTRLDRQAPVKLPMLQMS